MTSVKAQSNNIKHLLLQRHQMTLTQFSRQYGFKFRAVSDCVRGHRAGNYGTGREILEKLQTLTGLKLLSQDQQSH